jgi:hypothetical protein
MKKTIWQPVAIGTVLGLLAGIGIAAGLSFIIPGAFSSVIGFFTTLFLLAAALGGPLAGVVASTICVVIAAFFGSPDLKEALSDSVIFWSNVVVTGTFVALVGFAYRLIFERVKMPARLLPWAGIVIAYYVLYLPANAGAQFYLNGDSGFLSAVIGSYNAYIPQVFFDIFITSLVFIALPARNRRPQWYESKQTTNQSGKIQDE